MPFSAPALLAGLPADRPILVWLRDDLRTADNPALAVAVASGRPIVVVHCLDEHSPGLRPLGAASRWWLHHSLAALGSDIAALGGLLILRSGPAGDVIPALAAACRAGAVLWNRRYMPAAVEIDRGLKLRLRAEGVAVASFQAALLHEPQTIATKTGGPFKVFTPFWRACLAAPPPRAPLPRPTAIRGHGAAIESVALEALDLLPRRPDWSGGLAAAHTPGEAGAAARLARFVADGLGTYAAARDRPDRHGTSQLSPHLRFGEISPFQVAAAVAAARGADGGDRDKFLAEIGWREFAHHLAFHFGDLAIRNFQPRFDGFGWAPDAGLLAAWQRGQTGYPLVDAGLRELWATGVMHNRVRMVTASFLTKHGLVDWRDGERWFWDTLVDACPAVNPASWQWVAGSGADAAPYFRIFNPVAQGERFDPDGAYVRRWVPELAGLAADRIQAPWTASAAELARAGVALGRDYPRPIVDHATARARALAAFAATVDGSARALHP